MPVDSITDHVAVSNVLDTAVVAPVDHGLVCLLLDDPNVPADLRRIIVTDEDYTDYVGTSGTAYGYATTLFGQKRKPARLMVARWISEYNASYWAAGPGTLLASLIEVTAGKVDVTVDGGEPVHVTGLDLHTATTWESLFVLLNAAMTGAAAGCLWTLDALGRLTVTGADTSLGSGHSVVLSEVATDGGLWAALDGDNAIPQAGLDTETQVEAVVALRDLDDTWYLLHERGGVSEVVDHEEDGRVALSAYLNAAAGKSYDFVVTDATAKSSGVTDDLGSQLKALGHKKPLVFYHPNADLYGDAAAIGAVLPAPEGTVNFSAEELAGITSSELTASEKTILKTKGYSWFEAVDGVTTLYDGVTAGNVEKRIMIGSDWFTDAIRGDIRRLQLSSDLLAMDDMTLTALEGIIRTRMAQAVARRIGVDTAARPATVTMPKADDLDPAMRASRKFTQTKVWNLPLNNAMNDIDLSGIWTV